jgi:type IV pilus assembly protein PilB
MFANDSEAIFGFLSQSGLVPVDRLQSIRRESKVDGRPLADAVVDGGLIDRRRLLASLASALGCEFLETAPTSLPQNAVAALPGTLARQYGVAPLRADANGIALLTSDPFNLEARDDLTFVLSQNVRWVMADPDRVTDLVQAHYGEALPATDLAAIESEVISARELASLAEQAPVIRFVDLVLGQAIRDRASDIHLEPFEHEFKIRCRVDGVLYEMAPPPKSLALPIISRLKVLANLDIAERRLPQDGRIRFTEGKRAVDLRISTLPTQFGESVVLRVLDRAAVRLELDELGMSPSVLAEFKEIVARPNGILLVTGPTGSGKTTTLYSGLRTINTLDRKLLSAEDPVEYEVEGVTQVPINPATGLTFASALRSFLRQDPDGIMVGEIRDVETAQVAIQASLTGHMVLSTLHTNDAAGAVTRLVDMGIEPFLIASSLEGVLAQRLVRRLCPHCRKVVRDPKSVLEAAGLDLSFIEGRSVYSAAGCEHCDRTGYRGRLGLFEWLRVTEAVRDLITQKASTAVIREKAREQGMVTLREDGLRAIFAGDTTVEEVARYT